MGRTAVLVTGGSGFIGSNFIRYLLDSEGQVRVVNLDLLTYAGNLKNNEDAVGDDRYTFVRADIRDIEALDRVFTSNRIDVVINFAAETHVDRSIQNAGPFVETNVVGTQCLLEASRKHGVSRFVQISTDEVYGSLGEEGSFREDTPLDPTNPYSATKAGADLLVLSHVKTHRFPALITRCSNNYGPCQFPEKFIPLMVTNAMEDKPIPVYGRGINRREWIYVDDHSRAVWNAVTRGKDGEIYNIGSGVEVSNIDLVRQTLRTMGKPESLIRYVEDRPAHDLRYAMDCGKIRDQWGWDADTDLESGLARTIEWYRSHESWVREVKDASYLSYYEQQYSGLDRTALEG